MSCFKRSCVVPSLLLTVWISHMAPVSGGFPPESEIAVTLGQAFMGPVGTSTAMTRVSITNRALGPCQVHAMFSRGSATAPPVSINGELAQDNMVSFAIPRGGVQVLDFTSTILAQGTVAVAVDPPCSPDSLSVSGTYFVKSEAGLLEEAFSIPANAASDWLNKDRCVAISTNFDPQGLNGIPSNLGIATSSVVPGMEAPPETVISVNAFDVNGMALGEAVPFFFNGQHTPFFPLDAFLELAGQTLTVVFCLETLETGKGYQLDFTYVGVKGSPLDVQFENAIFADGFESGDVSAWSSVVP